MFVYAKYLSKKGSSLQCNGGTNSLSDLKSLVKTQVDCLLGSNPKCMSYMVGYGKKNPQKIHHGATSIVSIKKDPTPGGVVSVDGNDNYNDGRSNHQTVEPSTVVHGPFLGILACLA
ncbi:hypothetical protein Lal_00031380 [Lupinus albus]|nr:hypothetical protein Lal_00031380 [Lupinus albus]